MKRSQVNDIIRKTEKLLKEHEILLPPFLKWTLEEWQTKESEYDEIRDKLQ